MIDEWLEDCLGDLQVTQKVFYDGCLGRLVRRADGAIPVKQELNL